MLSATGVWFGYDARTPVLRGVTVTVSDGAFTGILGANGSGKTTLLRLLAGTRMAARGEVLLDARPLASYSRTALARRIAVVPQETHLAFDYTVAELAMMGRYAHLSAFAIEGPADIAVVEESLSATGTLHLKDRPFATLSGGEKQRVIIASALAQIFRLKAEATITGQPLDDRDDCSDDCGFRLQAEGTSGVLLLDEPTASLDLAYQLEIAALLKRLHAERGIAIVLATHDLGMAATLCREILFLRDGRSIAAGPTREVMTKDNVRAAFGVDVDLLTHPSGQQLVVPVRRT